LVLDSLSQIFLEELMIHKRSSTKRSAVTLWGYEETAVVLSLEIQFSLRNHCSALGIQHQPATSYENQILGWGGFVTPS
jgi:hypothetical protein